MQLKRGGREGGGRPFWRREQRPKSLAAAAPKNGEWEVKGVRRPDGRSVVGSPPLCTQGPAKKEKGNLLCGQARRDEETDFIGTPFSPSPVASTCLAWAVVLFLGGEEKGGGEKIDKARLKRSRSCIADSWIVALGSTVESAV